MARHLQALRSNADDDDDEGSVAAPSSTGESESEYVTMRRKNTLVRLGNNKKPKNVPHRAGTMKEAFAKRFLALDGRLDEVGGECPGTGARQGGGRRVRAARRREGWRRHSAPDKETDEDAQDEIPTQSRISFDTIRLSILKESTT